MSTRWIPAESRTRTALGSYQASPLLEAVSQHTDGMILIGVGGRAACNQIHAFGDVHTVVDRYCRGLQRMDTVGRQIRTTQRRSDHAQKVGPPLVHTIAVRLWDVES